MGKRLDLLALLLVIIGAANWGLVGLFKFDLVATLVGDEFGRVNLVSRLVYILVGVAGLYLVARVPRLTQRPTDVREAYA